MTSRGGIGRRESPRLLTPLARGIVIAVSADRRSAETALRTTVDSDSVRTDRQCVVFDAGVPRGATEEPLIRTQERSTAPTALHRAAPTVAEVMVYLVQHGHAKPEDEDPRRPLTNRGADDVTWVAHWAVDRFGVRPSRVLHSGKTRSRQTAEIWGRLVNVDAEEGADLAPNDDPTTWVRRLVAETGDMMLVGHLPHLAKLASLLLTGDPDRQLIGFQQGGLVAVEHTDAAWVVALLLPPSAA